MSRSGCDRRRGPYRPEHSEREQDRAEEGRCRPATCRARVGPGACGALARRAAGRRGEGVPPAMKGDPDACPINRDGLDRPDHRDPAHPMGRGPLDGRDRPPHGHHQERDRGQGPSPQAAGAAVADPGCVAGSREAGSTRQPPSSPGQPLPAPRSAAATPLRGQAAPCLLEPSPRPDRLPLARLPAAPARHMPVADRRAWQRLASTCAATSLRRASRTAPATAAAPTCARATLSTPSPRPDGEQP